MAGGNVTDWICFSKVLRAGLENQLPHHFKDTLRIAGARLFNLQSKKRARIVGKSITIWVMTCSAACLTFMQYSCAYWKDADNLESAQQAKLKMICEKLQLKPRDARTGYWLWLGRTGALHGV